MRVKRKHHRQFGFVHYIGFLLLCAIGFFMIVLGGNLALEYIHGRTDPPVSIQTTAPVQVINLEAVILETKGKIIQANVYIRLTDGSTSTIGSGVIYRTDELYYYAITNQHVISDSENRTKSVATFDLISSNFDILASSEELDLAVIRFDKTGRSNIIPITISEEATAIDEFVMAVGNPIGSMGSVTIGVIQEHTTIRSDVDIIQEVIKHSATIGNGSSGGALVDMYGSLVGLNSWGIGGNYYAIPSAIILNFIESQNLT